MLCLRTKNLEEKQGMRERQKVNKRTKEIKRNVVEKKKEKGWKPK